MKNTIIKTEESTNSPLRITPDFVENPLSINRGVEASFKLHGNIYRLVTENAHALVFEGTSRAGSIFFEVWFRLPTRKKSIKTDYAHPADEDFGVWAWNAYSKEEALKIFEEITGGIRVIIPMRSQV